MVSVPSSSSSVGHSADFARVTCLHQGPPSPPPALATLSPFTLHQNCSLTLINLLSLYSSTPHSTPATKPPFILHQNFLLTLCTLTLTSYLAEMHHNFYVSLKNLLLLTRLHQPPFPPLTLHQNIWWCTRVSVPKCGTCQYCTSMHTFNLPLFQSPSA